MNIDKNVIGIIDAIKRDILSTRNRIFENANRELISMYYRIGQIISENSRYGNQFVETLSSALKLDFPDATGYSVRNLFRMKKFYEEYKEFPILPPPVAELPWTHNCILIEKEKVMEKRLWYAEKTLENGWSKVVLDHQIDLKLYERQADNSKKLTNFPALLPQVQGELASDLMKDPYVFELAGLKEKISEKDIERRLLLCKKKDRLSVECALKAVNVPVGVASYEASHCLPTEEEINRLVSINS